MNAYLTGMNKLLGPRHEWPAVIATMALFLALIRTIAEPLRLQYHSETPITIAQIFPFLYAALAAAVGIAVMLVLQVYKKTWMAVGVALIVIGYMVYLKAKYLM